MSPKSKPTTTTREDRRARAKAEAAAAQSAADRRTLLTRVGVIAAAVVVVAGLFAIYRSAHDGSPGGSGHYTYQVGQPGPGDQAINFSLPSTKGGSVSLADLKGKTVLTYWHEGLGCQPCWDQIHAIERDQAALKAAGIDEFISITSGPLDALKQKMADDQLSSTTLADTNLAVSKEYQMNQFGMMGDSRDGHSFVLIGPNGKIEWRADYGGSPNYTMFVPVDTLLKQLEAGRSS